MNWLMLRGLAREQRHWGRFPEVFGAMLPGARVHCLDLPGTGTEHRRRTPASIQGIMEDLRGRLEPLRAQNPDPWSLLAVSLGGMVAMQWCADHPADFERLVLMNSSAGNLSPPWKRMNLRALPTVLLALLADRKPAARERRILARTTTMQSDLTAVAERWAAILSEKPIAKAAVLRQLVAASRFRAPPGLTLPVLVLSGARDAFTHPACPRAIAEHFRAHLEVHPRAGHDLALDDPEWVAQRVREWVELRRVA